jgi:hypothetical protein
MTIEQDLEREVAANRERIDRTIDAIHQKLTPGQLVDEGLNYLKRDTSGLLGSLGETIKANPIPTALVGVGLLWLLLASSLPQHSAEAEQSDTPPPM